MEVDHWGIDSPKRHGTEGPSADVPVASRKGRAAEAKEARTYRRALEAENARLREALTAFVECALFDAMMEGPRFKGWNRSALHRALAKARAALQPEPK